MLKSGRVWLGIAASAIFVFFLLRKIDPAQVIDAFRTANYFWIVPAVALYFVSVWVRAVRYRYIVRSVKPVSSGSLFPILVIGYMANNVLPARAGEFVRAHAMSERHGISRMSALGTVAVERLFDGLTLLGFLAVSVVFLGSEGALRKLTLIAVAVFALALAVFVGALAAPDAMERLIEQLSRLIPGRFREKAKNLAFSFIEGLRSLRHPDAFAWVTVTSLIAWLMEAAVYGLVGRAFGFDIGWGYYVMAVGAGNLAITAPSAQGGIGPFEFFVNLVLHHAGVLGAGAAAYSFAVHAVVILPATLLGLYYLWSLGISLRPTGRAPEPALETAQAGRPRGK